MTTTGHSSIIQNVTTWLAITEGTAREETPLTTPPVWRAPLDPATHTSAQITMWKIGNDTYNLYWFWNDEVIRTYKWAFPNNWNELEPTGHVKKAMVLARDYHDHILLVVRCLQRKDMTIRTNPQRTWDNDVRTKR